MRYVLLLLLLASEGLIASRVDYQCVSDCFKRGYTYQYCEKVCSY